MATTDEEKVSKIELIKRQSRHLRGTIKEALQDDQPKFSEENVQVLKFHGVYQQDDRDLRAQLKNEGKEQHYSMMIRARIPGGVLSPDQYLVFDRLADEYTDYQNMRITTRQTLQLHGILKGDLKTTIKTLNEALVTTLGACGDSGRNTICCAAPGDEPYRAEMRDDLLALADRLSAKTNAYHEIWVDGEPVHLAEGESEEPLYGEVYLPRKFKVALLHLIENGTDWAIFTTGTGLEALLQQAERMGIYDRLLETMRQSNVGARGYKTFAMLKQLGIQPMVMDDDGTTGGLIRALQAYDFAGQSVTIQLHGEPMPLLVTFFERKDASVRTILPYKHVAPDRDISDELCREIIEGSVDAVCFTTAVQVRYFYQYVKSNGIYLEINESFRNRVLAVAVGRVTAEALEEEGVSRILVPENERMGAMVVELAYLYQNKSTLRGNLE